MLSADTVFFDLDGTLVDARADIVNAVNYMLGKLGHEEKGFDEIVSYVGTGVSYLVSESLGSSGAELVAKGVRIYEERYIEHPADEARLYPHAVEILDYLSKKRKFIVTNRYSSLTYPVLDKLKIRKYFEAVVGGDDEKCLKPDACVLDKVLRKYGITKEKAVLVGDMAVDIMAGKNSGVRTCWANYGLGKAEDVAGLKPDFVIADLIELKKLIK